MKKKFLICKRTNGEVVTICSVHLSVLNICLDLPPSRASLRLSYNVTSRPMGHPALWATLSTIGNFKHYPRVATIIQSESEPLELLFSISFFSLSKTVWIGHFRGYFWALFVVFIDFVSFIICNNSSVMNTNLFCNIIFWVFECFLWISKKNYCFNFLHIVIILLWIILYVWIIHSL